MFLYYSPSKSSFLLNFLIFQNNLIYILCKNHKAFKYYFYILLNYFSFF